MKLDEIKVTITAPDMDDDEVNEATDACDKIRENIEEMVSKAIKQEPSLKGCTVKISGN